MINKLKYLFTILSITFLGMFGGQKNKGTRRYGIPGLAAILSFFSKNKKKFWIFLLLIPILCMGYGVNSFLMGILNSDFLVRIVYGALLSIPFIFFGLKRWTFTLISFIIAFSIRAGSLGTILGFDILIEDIIRYSVLGFWITYNIFKEE